MPAIHVRVKESTKKSAKKVLDKVGLDMSTAIKLYLNQIVITQAIPFRIVTENGLTIQQEDEVLKAEEEAEKGVNVDGPFSSKKEIKAYLDSLK